MQQKITYIMADNKYWESYYNTHLIFKDSSLFAKFISKEFKPSGKMIELGCGNGRDSVFFAKNNVEYITGVDQCPNVIAKLKNLSIPNAKFSQGDFTYLDEESKYDHIYSRFTLHSVGREEASRTLKWAHKVLNQKGQLYIEVRSVNDEFCGVGKDLGDDAWFSDHYRRFIRIDEMTKELESIGFKVAFKIESKGLAPYKKEDPSIIRIVADKI